MLPASIYSVLTALSVVVLLFLHALHFDIIRDCEFSDNLDLLYSDNAKAIAAGEAVDLAFKHKLSQIVIAVGS